MKSKHSVFLLGKVGLVAAIGIFSAMERTALSRAACTTAVTTTTTTMNVNVDFEVQDCVVSNANGVVGYREWNGSYSGAGLYAIADLDQPFIQIPQWCLNTSVSVPLSVDVSTDSYDFACDRTLVDASATTAAINNTIYVAPATATHANQTSGGFLFEQQFLMDLPTTAPTAPTGSAGTVNDNEISANFTYGKSGGNESARPSNGACGAGYVAVLGSNAAGNPSVNCRPFRANDI